MFQSFGPDDLVALLRGAMWTIAICAASGTIGTLLGLVLGSAAVSRNRIARTIAIVYLTVVRGVPLLLIIFLAYFGVPLAFPKVQISPFLTAVIALSVFSTAYMTEIFRGSLQAVDKGQQEAAEALGLSYLETQFFVMQPQAWRIAIPPGIGFLISLVKDSSLVTVMGFVELMRTGTIISNLTAQPIRVYLVVAVFYFVICYAMSLASRAAERSLAKGRRA